MSAPPKLGISPAVEIPKDTESSSVTTGKENLVLEAPRTVIRCHSAERIAVAPISPVVDCCNLIVEQSKAGCRTSVEEPADENNKRKVMDTIVANSERQNDESTSANSKPSVDESTVIRSMHSLDKTAACKSEPGVDESTAHISKPSVEGSVDDSRNACAEEPTAASCNPNLSDDEENVEQLERLKGDAIGDTLYSERFVLSTLLKLSTLDENYVIATDIEGYENDLCSVWDMTLEKSVVDLILSHGALELFAQGIEVTTDKRLTEILVGIVGNMCTFDNARLELAAHPEVIETLLKLISCTDTITLVQLMRVLAVVMIHDDPEDVHVMWYQKIESIPTFVESFTYILQNSVNVDLLTQAFEALYAILGKFLSISCLINSKKLDLPHSNIFVNEALILSTIEAFKVLVPHAKRSKKTRAEIPTEASTVESLILSQTIRKTMQIFLSIHVIFLQFEDKSTDERELHKKLLLPCLSQVIEPLCVPQNMMPLKNNVQGVIENVDEIFSAFEDPFDDRVFFQMITIWHLMHKYATAHLNPKSANDFEADADDEEETTIEEGALAEDIGNTILILITRIVCHANERQIAAALRTLQSQTILNIIEALSFNETEYEIKECREKLINGYKSLNLLHGFPKKTPTKHKSPNSSSRRGSDEESASSSQQSQKSTQKSPKKQVLKKSDKEGGDGISMPIPMSPEH